MTAAVAVRTGVCTVSAALAVAVAVPLVAFTTMAPVAAAAVVDGVTVTVALAPGFTLAELKVTVTPVGAVAVSVTGLVKPLLAPTATFNVTACP